MSAVPDTASSLFPLFPRVVSHSGRLKQLNYRLKKAHPTRPWLPWLKSPNWRVSTGSMPGSDGSSGGKLNPTWRSRALVVSLNTQWRNPLKLSSSTLILCVKFDMIHEKSTQDDDYYPGFSSSDGVKGGCSSVHHCWAELRPLLLHHWVETTQRRAVLPRQPLLPLPRHPTG